MNKNTIVKIDGDILEIINSAITHWVDLKEVSYIYKRTGLKPTSDIYHSIPARLDLVVRNEQYTINIDDEKTPDFDKTCDKIVKAWKKAVKGGK